MKQKLKLLSLAVLVLVVPVIFFASAKPTFAEYEEICQQSDPQRAANQFNFLFQENGVEKLCCCRYFPGETNWKVGGNKFCPSNNNYCTAHNITGRASGSSITVPTVTPGTLQITKDNPFDNLSDVVSKWFTVGFYIAVVLSVLMVFYGGFSYAIAAGDTGKTGEAKNIILDAVIGLGVALLAGAILVFLRGPGVFVFQ